MWKRMTTPGWHSRKQGKEQNALAFTSQWENTMKSLVAYFSAESGKTRNIAKALAEQTESTLFEIVPEKPYTEADLKWTNPLSRCNREKIGKKEVPIAERVQAWEAYDTIYLGFPIWYYGAPNVIQSFCKGYDWTGKKVYVFATSGGSGIGKTAQKLEPFMKGAGIADAKRVAGVGELSGWTRG